MKIIDKLSRTKPAFSFEFFPPKNEEGVEALYQTVARLQKYEPAFVSVTYGAAGSTRKLTVELVRRIKAETALETMAHLTCVGASRDEISQVLDQLKAAAVENVLPLRGDPPRGQPEFVKPPGGFGFASELVEFMRKHAAWDFCLAGACYPEKHPEAVSAEADLDNLKRKVDAGLDFLITQLFFDNADYFAFVDRLRSRGIDLPVMPGIMPVTNVAQIKRIAAMCGAKIPARLLERLEESGDDAEVARAIGIAHALGQCRELLERGAPGIHFYTLNRSPATVQILELLRG